MQKYTSAATSINSTKVPALFKKVKFAPDTINLDYGGGKYDTATNYLTTQGVCNNIYDPFNRTIDHNAQYIASMDNGIYDTATLSNVLNVIDNDRTRKRVICRAYKALKPNGTLYVTVYEGDKSGIGKVTSKGWQENRRLKSYQIEIERIFATSTIKNGVIIAQKEDVS